jgi:acetoin utilization protein AcuB
MQLESIMTPCPHTIDAAADVASATEAMRRHGVRHLPVMKGKTAVGILSERDLAIAGSVRGGDPMNANLTVWDVCTHAPFTVEVSTDLAVVAREMADRAIGSVLVLRDGELVGIVTSVDVARGLAEVLDGRATHG